MLHPHFDSDVEQLAARALRQIRREWRQHPIRPFQEQHPRLRGIDVTKVLHQRDTRDLGDGARHLHTRGPGADHDEGHGRGALRVVIGLLRDLESQQHAATDLESVVEALEAGRKLLPLIVTEIRVACPGGDDEIVVGNLAIRGDDPFLIEIDPLRFAKEHLRVFLLAQNVPQRLGDIGRRQRGGGDLVKQRLKQVMILPIEQGDPHIGLAQGLGGLEPAKAAADDDHSREIALMNFHKSLPDGTPYTESRRL